MKTKDFYKKILSKGIPLFMGAYGVTFLGYIRVKTVDTRFFIYSILVFLSLIVIVESVIALFRSIQILKRKEISYSRKICFHILILPYLPSVLGTIIYCGIRVLEYGILYKREFLMALGMSLFVNFTFVMFYNCKVDILR